MQALQAFKHLRTLELTMALDAGLQIRQAATELLSVNYSSSGSPQFYLKKEVVEEHIVSLYKQLAANDTRSTITSVKVRLETSRQYNEWLFVVQAHFRDGKSFRVEKDFSKANSGFIWNSLPALAYMDGDPFG